MYKPYKSKFGSDQMSKLHSIVGSCLQQFSDRPGVDIILGSDCGGHERVPLFTTPKKSRETNLCWVDAIILLHNRVHIIVEIEEKNSIAPIALFGKATAAGRAKYYIHHSKGDNPVQISRECTFIQVVDISRLARISKKELQLKNIEKEIQEILASPIFNIGAYKILCGSLEDFEKEGKLEDELLHLIRAKLD